MRCVVCDGFGCWVVGWGSFCLGLLGRGGDVFQVGVLEFGCVRSAKRARALFLLDDELEVVALSENDDSYCDHQAGTRVVIG